MQAPPDTRAGGAIRDGEESAFTDAAERHRAELHVHCYRMLGSLHDAEDAVQETFLRAWRYRDTLKDGAPLRPWLYRIATNVCLDTISRDKRRATFGDWTASDDDAALGEVTWLQPYPDAMLMAAPREAEPDARVVTKETIELAFLAVIQLLTPQQRAALILRDVLGWSAKQTADLLEVTVAAANGSLQRARAALRRHLPARPPEWPAGVDPDASERELLRKYVEASEKPDPSAFVELIREDAVFRMPPEAGTTVGRDAMIRLWEEGGFGTAEIGHLKCVLTRANFQPAVAVYLLKPGDTAAHALAMDVLRIEEGLITEIVAFPPDVFDAFGLPATI